MSSIPGLSQVFKEAKIESLKKIAPLIKKTKPCSYFFDVNLKTGKIVVLHEARTCKRQKDLTFYLNVRTDEKR